MENIRKSLTNMLLGNENLMKKFNKNSYSNTFVDYFKSNKELFRAIDDEYMSSEDKAVYIDTMAVGLIADVKEKRDAFTKKSDKQAFVIDHNSLLTVYVLPALMETHLDSCEELAKSILSKWNNEITDYSLSIGTFAEIDGGFKRKLCYITTAVCDSLGKSDDCYELKVLRNYRDTYLQVKPEGNALINEYYDVAPTIVNRINKCEDSAVIYNDIFNTYIRPCIKYIEAGLNEECQKLYTEMVRKLQKEYMGIAI